MLLCIVLCTYSSYVVAYLTYQLLDSLSSMTPLLLCSYTAFCYVPSFLPFLLPYYVAASYYSPTYANITITCLPYTYPTLPTPLTIPRTFSCVYYAMPNDVYACVACQHACAQHCACPSVGMASVPPWPMPTVILCPFSILKDTACPSWPSCSSPVALVDLPDSQAGVLDQLLCLPVFLEEEEEQQWQHPALLCKDRRTGQDRRRLPDLLACGTCPSPSPTLCPS